MTTYTVSTYANGARGALVVDATSVEAARRKARRRLLAGERIVSIHPLGGAVA